MVSFRGQKKLGPRPDRSSLKFPTSASLPLLSYAESPPPRDVEEAANEN